MLTVTANELAITVSIHPAAAAEWVTPREVPGASCAASRLRRNATGAYFDVQSVTEKATAFIRVAKSRAGALVRDDLGHVAIAPGVAYFISHVGASGAPVGAAYVYGHGVAHSQDVADTARSRLIWALANGPVAWRGRRWLAVTEDHQAFETCAISHWRAFGLVEVGELSDSHVIVTNSSDERLMPRAGYITDDGAERCRRHRA